MMKVNFEHLSKKQKLPDGETQWF